MLSFLFANTRVSILLHATVLVIAVALHLQGQNKSYLPILRTTDDRPVTVLSLEPPSGQAGTEVTIRGYGFSANAADNVVTFAQTNNTPVPARVLAATATSLTVVVPASAVTGPVIVQVGSKRSIAVTFMVLTVPVVTGAPSNVPPVVNAGLDQTITLPGVAALSGTVTDDGLPLGNTLTVKWAQGSGPGTVTFANAVALRTTARFSNPGTYVLRLTASDSVLSGTAEITIVVNAASPGKTYYVSNSGSNSNSGTSTSSPWKTMAKVQSFLGSLRAGDSVLFQRGGIWYEQLDIYRVNVNGSSGSPITFGNYGSGKLPIIDGGGTKSGYSVNGGRPFCIRGMYGKISYVTIDGFECRNTSAYGIAFNDIAGGSFGITVQNSYIHDTGNGDTGYHNQLQYFDWTQNTSSGGTKFLNNKVGNCYGHNCIQIDGDRNSPLMQGNECYGWSHNCIDVKRSQGARVDSNVVHDGLGIQQYGQAYYIENNSGLTWTSDVTWTRNVAYGTGFNAAFQCQDAGGPVSCYLYNNTVHATVIGNPYAKVMGVYGGADSGNTSRVWITVENNIFDTSSPRGGSGYKTWDYNDNVQSRTIGSHDMHIDPQYVNAGAHNFHLQSSSPVIRKGTNVGLPYLGSAPDLGAFQH